MALITPYCFVHTVLWYCCVYCVSSDINIPINLLFIAWNNDIWAHMSDMDNVVPIFTIFLSTATIWTKCQCFNQKWIMKCTAAHNFNAVLHRNWKRNLYLSFGCCNLNQVHWSWNLRINKICLGMKCFTILPYKRVSLFVIPSSLEVCHFLLFSLDFI